MIDDLREEIGVQKRLVKCQLRWAGHLAWIGEERMAKRADRSREQGRGKRGGCG